MVFKHAASGPSTAAIKPRSAGIGRTSDPAAETVSDDLRRGDSEFLGARRRMAALTLGAIGSFVVVALYQFGLIRHLPEPKLPGLDSWLDSDRVDASGEAYVTLRTPDAALGIASYAVTLALIGMGARDRARTRPLVVLAMGAKVAFDVAGGVVLTAEQATKHRAFCTWCLAATACTVLLVPPALPEVREAARSLWERAR